jgi:hypothetical protein
MDFMFDLIGVGALLFLVFLGLGLGDYFSNKK